MAKRPTDLVIIDNLKKISTKNLKDLHFLDSSFKSEILTIKNKLIPQEIEHSFRLTVSTQNGNSYAQFEYEIGCRYYKHIVPLVQLKSNLGKGYLWYFQCPVTKKRCRVLHFCTNAFVHRSAIADHIYDNQTLQKRHRSVDSLGKKIKKAQQLSYQLQKPYAKTRYNDMFTKKMRRLISVNDGFSIN